MSNEEKTQSQNESNSKKIFKFEKINIDNDEKLIAYNRYHEYSRKIIEESIKINALIRQVNMHLVNVARRTLILNAKKKCLDEYALVCYNEDGPKIFSSPLIFNPTIPDLDLNYVYNPIANVVHLESEDPLLSTPSTPRSNTYDEDDDTLLSQFDMTQSIKISSQVKTPGGSLINDNAKKIKK